jgi:hypothetical protein
MAEHLPRPSKVESLSHRHLSNIDCLSFVMFLQIAPVLIGVFFAAAVNSTNEANKAGGMGH